MISRSRTDFPVPEKVLAANENGQREELTSTSGVEKAFAFIYEFEYSLLFLTEEDRGGLLRRRSFGSTLFCYAHDLGSQG